MIKHIVFFSAKDSKDIPRIKEALLTYQQIPYVSKIEIAENSKRDGLSNEIDIVLYAEFESFEAVEGYKKHPIFLAGIEVVRPLRRLRYAVDFEC